jgi:hypothetical protein
MITFLGSFLTLSFDRTFTSTRATVAGVCLAVLILILWCANDAWDRGVQERLGTALVQIATLGLARIKGYNDVPQPTIVVPRDADPCTPVNEVISNGPDTKEPTRWHKIVAKVPWNRRAGQQTPSTTMAAEDHELQSYA